METVIEYLLNESTQEALRLQTVVPNLSLLPDVFFKNSAKIHDMKSWNFIIP